MTATFYIILGITQSASQDEVKKAFRTLAKKHHPDHGGNAEEFKKLSQAYATLSDPAKRRQYDLTIPSAPSTSSQARTYQTSNPGFGYDAFFDEFEVQRQVDEMTREFMKKYGFYSTQTSQNGTTKKTTTTFTATRMAAEQQEKGRPMNPDYMQSQRNQPHEVYFNSVTGLFSTRPKRL